MLKPLIKDIDDAKSSENFQRIEDFIRDEDIFKGLFKHVELSFSAGSYPATIVVPHTLGFKPLDIIQTSVTGGTLTWNYSAFTKETLSATVSAACSVRAFIGCYSGGQVV